MRNGDMDRIPMGPRSPMSDENDFTVMEHNGKKYLVQVLERGPDWARVRLIKDGTIVTLRKCGPEDCDD
jgi:hypothetical protein